MTAENLPKAGYKLAKIAVGGVILLGLAATTMVYAQAKPLHVADKVELDKYLGVWYEIARKPMSFQNQCDSNVTATYTFNENGNVLSFVFSRTNFLTPSASGRRAVFILSRQEAACRMSVFFIR